MEIFILFIVSAVVLRIAYALNETFFVFCVIALLPIVVGYCTSFH